jgi:hypothetical protein
MGLMGLRKINPILLREFVELAERHGLQAPLASGFFVGQNTPGNTANSIRVHFSIVMLPVLRIVS